MVSPSPSILPCAICAFTARGIDLAMRLAAPLDAKVYAPEARCIQGVSPLGGLPDWTEHTFGHAEALVFIGAVGIAVRAIAPHIKDKTRDPAVVVIDEQARHVIPILSGHIGGANDLAIRIAALTGAEPVITTATDLAGLPAIDAWAARADIAIENPEAIKAVSAATLEGQRVGVAFTERTIHPPFPVTLMLRPRTLTVGIGCRKGIPREHLEACFNDFLKTTGVSMLSVKALASIDLKVNEPAIRYLAKKYHWPLITYSAAQLRAVPGEFASSKRVAATVGVDNVCERAAALAGGGRLLRGKTIYPGATFALAGEEPNL